MDMLKNQHEKLAKKAKEYVKNGTAFQSDSILAIFIKAELRKQKKAA